ncbi:MAG: S41 family peptidase [Lachnospiraceae bacterium]|nr:S41 family peptidase [Lachnospiraceae bacterium]
MEENEQVTTEKKPSSFRKGVLAGVLGCLVVLAAILVTGWFFLGRLYDAGFMDFKDIAKAKVISGLIDKYYYKNVSDTAKTNGVYKGLMEAMDDPYTKYMTASEYKEELEDTSGQYVGIGVSVLRDSKTKKVTVHQVFEGSSADKAGIEKGDVLISADGAFAENLTLNEFTKKIRGKAGSEVTIVYSHNGEQHTVKLKRAAVENPSVYGKMLDESAGIGYIEITEFNSKTQEEFEKTLSSLKKQGLKAVIYDLRTNPGGLVDSVTKILDDILPKGTTVYMMDKYGKKTTYSSDDKKQEKLPTVVLTSGDTASAAEIFSGAVRDFKYGTLIGTKTFGKGIVQQEFTLGDGSALKMTVETYYTPSGECIHKKGIEPDIELEYKYTGDASKVTDMGSYDFSKDNQVQKGISVLKGKLDN